MRVQNVVIDRGAVALVGIGVVVGYWWAVSWLADAHGLGSARACVGLDLAGDRRAHPRMGNGVRRSDRVLDRKQRPSISRPWRSVIDTARLGNPVTVAVAGLIGGALLAWRARSLRPVAVVIGTVGGAVLAKTAIRAVIYRPLTEAEIQASPLLCTGHHPFPSGHVAGIGALLGIIAACISVGRSRTVQALATALVGAGVVIVAFSRLYLGFHWHGDVIGGALLAGLFVILGALALTTHSGQSFRAKSAHCPA